VSDDNLYRRLTEPSAFEVFLAYCGRAVYGIVVIAGGVVVGLWLARVLGVIH